MHSVVGTPSNGGIAIMATPALGVLDKLFVSQFYRDTCTTCHISKKIVNRFVGSFHESLSCQLFLKTAATVNAPTEQRIT
jgi:hypothetical protein